MKMLDTRIATTGLLVTQESFGLCLQLQSSAKPINFIMCIVPNRAEQIHWVLADLMTSR